MGEYFSDLHTKKTKTILLLHILPIELKKTFTYICVCISAHIYINMPPDINFEIFLYYYMRIPSPMSSHIIAAADAWCV